MKKLSITMIIVIILAACSASKITSSWKAKDAPPVYYQKIMVIGLMKDSNAAFRREMETHFVGDLHNEGYNALSAYDEFGPKAFMNMDENKMMEHIRNKGFDAALTIVLLNKQNEKEYIPGRVIYSPYFVHQGRFWNYYHTMYARIETEGYYATHTRYFWETNLYDMATRKLVYSVQTESFDPATTVTMAHEYGRLIVKHMISNKVIDTTVALH